MKGHDKAFLKINHEPLIKKQLKILRKFFKKIIIVTNSPSKYNGLKGINPIRNTEFSDEDNIISNGIRVISDVIPHLGPLGGIYSGLRASSSFYNFVVACDMPFINEKLVKYMIKNIKNFDIFIPKIDNKFHPLCGIYSKNCIPIIEYRLTQDWLKVSDIFSKLKAKFISKKKLQSFDKDLLCLENINTLQDFKNINRKRCY